MLSGTDGAIALAGGQTLINVMKARAASPDVLVDLARLPELKGIELAADGTLTIGAMTTYTELMASSEARARPILGEVCGQIADVQVRNRGTLGGNICSNDPTNHLPPLMVALGARMTIAGADGEREVSAEDFFLGVYMTAAGPGELLTKISIAPGKRTASQRSRSASKAPASSTSPRASRTASASRSAASMPCRCCCSPSRPTPRPCAPRSAPPTSIRRPTFTHRASTACTWPRCSPRAPSIRQPRERGVEWRHQTRPSRTASRSPSRSTAPNTSGRWRRASC